MSSHLFLFSVVQADILKNHYYVSGFSSALQGLLNTQHPQKSYGNFFLFADTAFLKHEVMHMLSQWLRLVSEKQKVGRVTRRVGCCI